MTPTGEGLCVLALELLSSSAIGQKAISGRYSKSQIRNSLSDTVPGEQETLSTGTVLSEITFVTFYHRAVRAQMTWVRKDCM